MDAPVCNSNFTDVTLYLTYISRIQ